MEYLDGIVADVRRRVEERMAAVPLRELRTWNAPERASFLEALQSPGLSLIAEVKRASPSKGSLRPDVDVAELVRHYEAAGAAAVSVLTEQDHFQGSLDDLRTAEGATSLPLLQKDFVLDEYQLHEARALGASAVLLIVAILDRDEFLALGETADRLGLDVLAEVHGEEELEQALALERAVLGINNRDLRSFEVSLETTFRLVSQVPPERTVVSESGIRGRDDFVRLEAAGVDGVLVGEHLLRSGDVEAAIRELLLRS
jgi:indole-3-glycerol phosphate synthase